MRHQQKHPVLLSIDSASPDDSLTRMLRMPCRNCIHEGLLSLCVLGSHPIIPNWQAAFIRVVMPVKSKTDNCRVPGASLSSTHDRTTE